MTEPSVEQFFVSAPRDDDDLERAAMRAKEVAETSTQMMMATMRLSPVSEGGGDIMRRREEQLADLPAERVRKDIELMRTLADNFVRRGPDVHMFPLVFLESPLEAGANYYDHKFLVYPGAMSHMDNFRWGPLRDVLGRLLAYSPPKVIDPCIPVRGRVGDTI
jgi:hypothetical protein